ncbi:hypothetical protein Hanom_Chr13g01223561 [Helianthus anomalus]
MVPPPLESNPSRLSTVAKLRSDERSKRQHSCVGEKRNRSGLQPSFCLPHPKNHKKKKKQFDHHHRTNNIHLIKQQQVLKDIFLGLKRKDPI